MTVDLNLIRDQRTMVGERRHETVEQVEAAWEDWVARHGLPIRQREGDNSINLRDSHRTVVAYVSGGKWIADCPRCNGGVACWRENPRGACLDCGTIYRVDYPSRDEETCAVEALARRPLAARRSWHRHQGETIDDLLADNDRYLGDPEPEDDRVVSLGAVERLLGHAAADRLRRDGVV